MKAKVAKGSRAPKVPNKEYSDKAKNLMDEAGMHAVTHGHRKLSGSLLSEICGGGSPNDMGEENEELPYADKKTKRGRDY